MISLGIEGTAHTLGIGLIDEGGNVLADVKRTYSPTEGGIHPRDAARHMVDSFGDALKEALEISKIDRGDINIVSFAQGPGLGPCLSNSAVAARALALSLNRPIVGVNHCVAHIEIGNLIAKREFQDWSRPLILYVSGGNTQILMLKEKRYRVFGETLDIGVGNMLDKFGRAVGLQHPAGPKIEELASNGRGYLELPYVVKGNDLSFSGILTESLKRVETKSLDDVCYSLQETAFAMLTEATERALCHLKSRHLLLTGGVANNKRLQQMLKTMAGENGVNFSVPRGYCGDNGVMIAWTGILMYKSGFRQEIENTRVNQDFRTDDVVIEWFEPVNIKPEEKRGMWKGAEALLTIEDGKIKKNRVKKAYRVDEIDETIRKSRTTREARLLEASLASGVKSPRVSKVSREQCTLHMEYLEGPTAANFFESHGNDRKLSERIGLYIAKLHNAGIIHGDLTTSNMVIAKGDVYLVDFGLGGFSNRIEDKATDLLLLKKSLNANHPAHFDRIWPDVLSGYREAVEFSDTVSRLEKAEKRGRYL
ncbi:MAG: bifunctional N(6)-L-threonylcarbamoyladenine synthase/serine/threonine protein kinase [Candidatus Altiarchaeota archaeon]|nr:bifunctional N(6)-L-threonylcarbamoyladenine synthase/serine/threonine protein kinase [Candidatus Altiarchaeota archaeon]